MPNHEQLEVIMKQKPLVGLFFQTYGYNDGFFAIVFFIAFIVALTTRSAPPKVKTR